MTTPKLTIRVDARENGHSLRGFPLTTTYELAALRDVHDPSFPVPPADVYRWFPTEEIDPITVLSLLAEGGIVILRLQGKVGDTLAIQSDRGVKLDDGGFIVIFGTSLPYTQNDPNVESTQAQVKNNATDWVQLSSVLVGE